MVFGETVPQQRGRGAVVSETAIFHQVVRLLPIVLPATNWMPASLPASLLLGDVADHRELERLSLIGLEHQNQPDHKPGQTDQRPQKDCCPPKEWDVADECQYDPESTAQAIAKKMH